MDENRQDRKQANFRLDQDIADEFRTLCKELGVNQSQGFAHIMEVVRLSRAKTAVPERRVEVEMFEKYLKDIMAAYTLSIEINANAEARIREEFQYDLTKKIKKIAEYEDKIEELKIEKADAKTAQNLAEKAQKDATERAQNAVSQMEAAKKTAADQERINSMLTEKLDDAVAKLDDYEEIKASEAALKADVAELKSQLKESESKLAHTEELHQARIDEVLAKAERYKAALEKTESALSKAEADAERTESSLKKQLEEKEARLAAEKLSKAEALEEAETKAELAKDLAVLTKEHEMQAHVRAIEKEKEDLEAKVSQLQMRLSELEAHITSLQNKKAG